MTNTVWFLVFMFCSCHFIFSHQEILNADKTGPYLCEISGKCPKRVPRNPSNVLPAVLSVQQSILAVGKFAGFRKLGNQNARMWNCRHLFYYFVSRIQISILCLLQAGFQLDFVDSINCNFYSI